MNLRRILPAFAVLSLLLTTGLGFGGCGRDADSPSPTGLTEGKKPGGGPLVPKETFLVEVIDPVAAAQILAEEGATITLDLDDIGVWVVEAQPDFVIKVENRSSPALIIETPIRTGLTDGSEMIMTFFETYRPAFDYRGVGGLNVLDMNTIHTAGTGFGVEIALLDTPVDFNHPHLQGHVVATAVPGLDSPALKIDLNPTDAKAYGHGTNMAGIIATMAPGARIHPFAVLNDEGIGTTEELAIALNAVYDMVTGPGGPYFDILNLSLSIAGDSSIIRRAIEKLNVKGVYVMCAAGNTGETTGNVLNPAAYDGAIAIGATLGDSVAFFSAEGDVDLGAPGAGVISSYPSGEMWESSGTSMATAVASGALAVLLGPVQTQADIDPPLQRFYDTADAIASDGGPGFLHGRLSLLRSLQMFSLPKQ